MPRPAKNSLQRQRRNSCQLSQLAKPCGRIAILEGAIVPNDGSQLVQSAGLRLIVPREPELRLPIVPGSKPAKFTYTFGYAAELQEPGAMNLSFLSTGGCGALKPIARCRDIRVDGITAGILPGEDQLSIDIAGCCRGDPFGDPGAAIGQFFSEAW